MCLGIRADAFGQLQQRHHEIQLWPEWKCSRRAVVRRATCSGGGGGGARGRGPLAGAGVASAIMRRICFYQFVSFLFPSCYGHSRFRLIYSVASGW